MLVGCGICEVLYRYKSYGISLIDKFVGGGQWDKNTL